MKPVDVTLVVPCRNEEKYLPALFKSIDAQKIQGSTLEIIFVDGVSTDGTLAMLAEYAHGRPNVKVLENRTKIVPNAMNLGIKAAAGNLIVRIDAHAEYASDYVGKCLEFSSRTEAENVGGPMLAKGDGYIGKSIELSHGSSFGLGGGKFHDGKFEGYVDTVYLGAFRKKIFETVGYYDERLVRNQDIELNARIRNGGGSIYLTPEIRSSYKCRSTLRGLWRQNFSNGVWAIYTRAIAPYALSLRHFVPFVFVMTLLINLIVAVIPGLPLLIRISPLVATIIFYVAANLFFSLTLALTDHGRYFFMLPIVFATLHFSYGIGSLWGLLTLPAWLHKQTSDHHFGTGNHRDQN